MAHLATPPPSRPRGRQQSPSSTDRNQQPLAMFPIEVQNQQAYTRNHHRAATSPPHTPTRPSPVPQQPAQRHEMAAGGPQSSNADDGAASDSVTSSGKKVKTRRKRRQKNDAASTSSLSTEDDRSSTGDTSNAKSRPVSVSEPLTATGSTPAKSFYAGPTFHASPAASKLPIPKFSKSVPVEAPQSSMQSRLDQESDRSTSSSSSDSTPTTPTAPHHLGSPLDFLLNAHRQEQAQKTNGNTGGGSGASAFPFPEPQNLHPQFPSPSPGHHMRSLSNNPVNGVAFELDGNSGLNRDAGSRASSEPPKASQGGQREESPHAKALKEYLFSVSNGGSPLPTPPPTAASRSASASAKHSPSPSPLATSSARNSPRLLTPDRAGNDSSGNSFHYGNRNLSPLFQASATDVGKRSSGLRQEVLSSPVDRAELQDPQSPTSPTPTRQTFSQSGNALSRQYLDATVQAANLGQNVQFPYLNKQRSTPSTPGEMRQPYFPRSASSGPSEVNGNANGNYSVFAEDSSADRRAATRPVSEQSNEPARGHGATPQDVKSMEENLRRMLKLGGVGSNPSGVKQTV